MGWVISNISDGDVNRKSNPYGIHFKQGKWLNVNFQTILVWVRDTGAAASNVPNKRDLISLLLSQVAVYSISNALKERNNQLRDFVKSSINLVSKVSQLPTIGEREEGRAER